MNGDFGRVRSSLQREDVHDWMSPDKPGAPPWRHQFTDEERRLRDLAYPLIEPPYDRNQWYSALAEYGAWVREWPVPPRGAYASRLLTTPYRSQTARYNRLIEDIRNDLTRIDPFFAVAHYVASMDEKRAQSLRYISSLTAEEHDRTTSRIRENAVVVRWVKASLRARAASYQVALEQLVIAAPSAVAAEADRQLALLRQRIAGEDG